MTCWNSNIMRKLKQSSSMFSFLTTILNKRTFGKLSSYLRFTKSLKSSLWEWEIYLGLGFYFFILHSNRRAYYQMFKFCNPTTGYKHNLSGHKYFVPSMSDSSTLNVVEVQGFQKHSKSWWLQKHSVVSLLNYQYL